MLILDKGSYSLCRKKNSNCKGDCNHKNTKNGYNGSPCIFLSDMPRNSFIHKALHFICEKFRRTILPSELSDSNSFKTTNLYFKRPYLAAASRLEVTDESILAVIPYPSCSIFWPYSSEQIKSRYSFTAPAASPLVYMCSYPQTGYFPL